MKKQKEPIFVEGQILIYTGGGFVGFDKSNPEVEFINYSDHYDAMVKYKDFKVLVSKYDLKPIVIGYTPFC
jgi:hypothetical protein